MAEAVAADFCLATDLFMYSSRSGLGIDGSLFFAVTCFDAFRSLGLRSVEFFSWLESLSVMNSWGKNAKIAALFLMCF